MIGRPILALAILTSLTACDSPATPTPRPVVPSPPAATATVPAAATPTLTPIPTPTTAQAYTMYLAVSNAFFNSEAVHGVLRPDLLHEKVVYIDPAFDYGRGAPIPQEILALLARHTAALGLARVPQKVTGGVAVSVGQISRDPENTRLVYGKEGATVWMGVVIVGQECGTWTGISYLLTPTDHGWQVEQYGMAVC
jgi:hypothetical protein